MGVELFIVAGVIAALINKMSGKVSTSDVFESAIATIPALIVAFYVAMLLGLMSLPTTGWIGAIITTTGALGLIIGPIIVGLFYGIVYIVTAVATYYFIKELKL